MVEIKTNTHTVIKNDDILKFLTDTEIFMLKLLINKIIQGRKTEGREPDNEYYVVNKDEPYSKRILEMILEYEEEKHLCMEKIRNADSFDEVTNIINEYAESVSDDTERSV